MEKIELTKEEIKVIGMYFKGQVEVWTTDEEIQKNMSSVIDKADALMDELDAFDDMCDNHDGDMIRWFWHKYKEQQKKQ